MDWLSVLLLALRAGIAILLYLFLAWALVTLWRSLRLEGLAGANRRALLITLQFSGAGLPEEMQFSQPQVILGRDPACECVLNHATVSARHARLSFHHNQWWLEDLDSTNGTFLNDQPLSTEAVLADYDQVRCGEVAFTVLVAG